MKTTKIFIALAAVVLVGALAFVYLGVYNIGADAPHWKPTLTMIDTFRERSIAMRAGRIKVTALDDPAMIAEGAEHYAAMCVQCHLAPGQKDSELREGLYPLPPNLAEHKHDEEGQNDSAARQFWIVKHGIKMTSMPAAGKTHDDEEIWGIVAFVRKLPNMTPEEYAQLTSKGGHAHDGAESDAHAAPEQPDEHHHEHGDTSPAPEHAHEPQAESPN